MRQFSFFGLILGLSLYASAASTTQPTTNPGGTVAPNSQIFHDLLQPANPAAQVLQPLQQPANTTDVSSGAGATAPNAPDIKLIREGSYIVNRIGRLSTSPDGQQSTFIFESDGKALQDPPMIILPNLMLMSMEAAVTSSNRDLKFRITGMVTEYKGHNCVLIQKVVPVREAGDQF